MSTIGIVGYGFVGKAVEYVFKDQHKVLWNDINPNLKGGSSLESVVNDSEFIFVCVPTPTKNKKQRLTDMSRCIKKVAKRTNKTNKIIIIKSTILPGTTNNYAQKYPETNFCFSPEFLRELHWKEDSENPDRIVIGTENDNVAKKVLRLHEERFPDIPVYCVNFKIAEMIKYGSNAYLAKDIIFGNEIYDLCETLEIDYDSVRKILSVDERIKGPLAVTEERGYGGKCLPKDTEALQGLYKKLGVPCPLLAAVTKRNREIRKDKDWKKIPGALED